MRAVGYALSSEEHGPCNLVRHARLAEDAGFEFALISDHYHPWTSTQGHSSFVWGVLGAIAASTSTLRVGTGVTCPIMRIHPAILAQAAATAAMQFDGRFFFGIGAGENLNEHVLGERWPRVPERHARLTEAIDIIRELWTGDEISFAGNYFQVDEARLYSLPDEPPPLLLAASGPQAAEMAGEQADGLIATSPDEKTMKSFRNAGAGKPTYGQVTVCWAKSERDARRTVHDCWPQTGLAGKLSWELKTPAQIESACEPLSEEQVVEHVPCGPDPARYLEAIQQYRDVGFEYIYLHQVGPDQEGFCRFFEHELAPHLQPP